MTILYTIKSTIYIIILLVNLFGPSQQQHLPCEDIEKSIKISNKMNSGGRVKNIFRGTYKNNEIVLAYPVDEIVMDDFSHGLEMMVAFQGSSFVPELFGYCRKREELKVGAKVNFITLILANFEPKFAYFTSFISKVLYSK